MAELKKYLDKAGLQVVWNAAKAKFIDDVELAAQLANYATLEELARDYATKAELNSAINALAAVYATKTELANGLATKVDKEITSSTGKALIFNESDGGGAKFEHVDGSESFVGVNNGGKDGLMAQIYADKLVDGKWQGAKLDVYNGGIYYTVGNKTAAERKNADNELVVKKDIKDLAGGMHFIGTTVLQAGETVPQAIERLYTEKGKVYADRKPGDIVIIVTPGISQEYICDSEKQWVELGSEGIYATKAELASEESDRQEADAALETAISAEASARATADAGKLDKMPGDEHTGGNAYNLPYYFYTVPGANKVEVHTKTVTLDGNKTYGDYSLDVNAATATVAGLMAAADKDKLDNISTLTQAEIEDICK